jgi:nitrate reductase NapAB chaperone NapD
MYSVPVAIDGMSTAAETFQVAATCTILNINFNGVNTNVLGLAVVIDPMLVVIEANDNEVLGNLICTTLDTVENVVSLVGVLNEILDLINF